MEMLETMQRLWRRVGEGDADEVRKATGDVAQKINAILYWPTTLWVMLKKLWPAVALTLALFFLGLYLQSRKIAWRNRLLRIALDSLRRRDYVLISRAGAFVSDCRQQMPEDIEIFSEYLHDSRSRTVRLEENIRQDLAHWGKRRMAVDELIQEAWENAVSQFRLAYPNANHPPESPVMEGQWDGFLLTKCRIGWWPCFRTGSTTLSKNDAYESNFIAVSPWRKKRKLKGLCVCSPHLESVPVSDLPSGPLPPRVYKHMAEQTKTAYDRPPVVKEIETKKADGVRGKWSVLLLPVPIIYV